MAKMRSLRLVALGAALSYFFDPDNGRSRRKAVIKRINRLARRGADRTGELAESAGKVKEKAAQAVGTEPQDDVTLARNVETEIFRDADALQGKINVDAENGVVVLRGEADTPELIDDLAERARKVQGVREVENLLQVPGAPAPAESD